METDEGALPFQDWLVRRRAEPRVSAIRFDGAGAAPAPGVLAAIAGADRVLLAPSNPFISLDPILAVAGVREAVTAAPRRRRRGVADHRRPGREGAARGAARLARPRAQRARRGPLPGAAGGHVRAGRADARAGAAIEALGVRVIVADTLMQDPAVRAALARTALAA